MTGDGTVTLHEQTVAGNWPAGRRPDYADERTRLYAGVSIRAAGQEWTSIVTAFDGQYTTAYLTHAGFDVSRHGPAIHRIKGAMACHRKVMRQWFRDTYGMGVAFA